MPSIHLKLILDTVKGKSICKSHPFEITYTTKDREMCCKVFYLFSKIFSFLCNILPRKKIGYRAPSLILISYSTEKSFRGKDLEKNASAPCCIWIEKICTRTRTSAFVITCLRQNLKSFDTCCGRRTRARVEMWVTLHTYAHSSSRGLRYPNAPMTWLSGFGVTSPRDASRRAFALAKSR